MIVFTKHALERMKQRGISREEVIRAIESSQKTVQDTLGHSIAQLQEDGRILRVFYVQRNGDLLVITTYRSSKTKYLEE